MQDKVSNQLLKTLNLNGFKPILIFSANLYLSFIAIEKCEYV
jgi:hypothetical protein